MAVERYGKYRPEIDGLRAIAIVSVVAYHVRVPGFSGGFVGVDIFFVLSGFLITALLKEEFDRSGRIDLLRFYARRARRLFPNLFLMLFAASLVALFLLLPAEQNMLGKSLIAATVYASNIFFLDAINYFSPEAESFPFLHTWSLAVEEQFYLFWPILLLVAAWLGSRLSSKNMFPYLASAAGLLSLALSIWGSEHHTKAAFFLTPTRVWEFSIGGLLGYYSDRFPKLSASWATAASILGAALLLLSVFRLHERLAYPGIYALLPAFGTLAIIFACCISPRALLTRILSTRPLVWVGLISYSLYLWHWPILVYSRDLLIGDLKYYHTAAIVMFSTLIAWLAWKFVEVPIRQGRCALFARERTAVVWASAATALSLVFGTALWQSKSGLMPIFSDEVLAAEAAADDQSPWQSSCFVRDADTPPSEHVCVAGAQGSGYQAVLWGDSHADHLMPALAAAGREGAFRVRQISSLACPPLMGISVQRNGVVDDNCRLFNERVLQELGRLKHQMRLVVLAANWDLYIPRERARGAIEYNVAVPGQSPGPHRSTIALRRGLAQTIASLSSEGIAVLVIGQLPEFRKDVPQCLARAQHLNRPITLCGVPRSRMESRRSRVMRILREVVQDSEGARLLDLADSICGPKFCLPLRGGKILYSDDDHLTTTGARMLADRIYEEIRIDMM